MWRWGHTSPGRFLWVARRTWQIGLAELRRQRRQRRIGAPIPRVVAVSPTMLCNYDCGGCYSRGRDGGRELSSAELSALFSEAEDLGVLSVIITGGEPFLRDDLLQAMASHRRLLFVLITNGSLVTEDAAKRLQGSGNTIPLVSIEGFESDTDGRRKRGAHSSALEALERFRAADLCFGFAAMNTSANTERVASDDFIDDMSRRGCSLGFLTEYVPVGEAPRTDWIVSEGVGSALRSRVLEIRRTRSLVLIQFPHDEYGDDNTCTAAGRASLHVGSTGDVEPCPFVPVSCENIRDGGLAAACRSRFFAEIRGRPELLRRDKHACALFEHRDDIEEIARRVRGGPGVDRD